MNYLDRRKFLRLSGAALVAPSALTGLSSEKAIGMVPGPDAVNPAQKSNTRPFPIRECYCPAHFGNFYEAAWPNEMKAYLAEMQWMGFNRYSDWLTTTDACNPYASDATWDLATEQLERKKRAFHAAQSLGMGIGIIAAPNHVYLDQLRPRYSATKTKRIIGQLVCPSIPEARDLILDNYIRWFKDLADEGIKIDAITAFAYDYGGCDCDKCRPWILTFARLMKEIHTIAQKWHPGVEI